jgi:hypothetical protein
MLFFAIIIISSSLPDRTGAEALRHDFSVQSCKALNWLHTVRPTNFTPLLDHSVN